MSDNLKSKPLVEGAILTAVLYIIMLFSIIPSLYIFSAILVPIPVAILYIKHGVKIPIISLIVALIIGSASIGPIYALMSVISALCIGFPLGFGVRKRISSTYTLVYVFLANIVGQLISFAIMIYIVMGVNLYTVIQNVVNSYRDAMKVSMQATHNQAVIDNFNRILSSITVDKVILVIPAAFLLYAFVGAVVNYIVAARVMKRLNFKVQRLKNFNKWYISPYVIVGFIVLSIIGAMFESNGLNIGDKIFWSSWYILFIMLGLQGASLAAYFLSDRLRLNSVITGIILILITVTGFFLYLFIIGMADVLIDYRGVDPGSLGNFIRQKINDNKK